MKLLPFQRCAKEVDCSAILTYIMEGSTHSTQASNQRKSVYHALSWARVSEIMEHNDVLYMCMLGFTEQLTPKHARKARDVCAMHQSLDPLVRPINFFNHKLC